MRRIIVSQCFFPSAIALLMLAMLLHAKPERPAPPVPAKEPTIRRVGERRYTVTIPEWRDPIPMEFETIRTDDGRTFPSLYQLTEDE